MTRHHLTLATLALVGVTALLATSMAVGAYLALGHADECDAAIEGAAR